MMAYHTPPTKPDQAQPNPNPNPIHSPFMCVPAHVCVWVGAKKRKQFSVTSNRGGDPEPEPGPEPELELELEPVKTVDRRLKRCCSICTALLPFAGPAPSTESPPLPRLLLTTLTGFRRDSPPDLAPNLGVCFDSLGTLSARDTNSEMCNGGTARTESGSGPGPGHSLQPVPLDSKSSMMG